MTSSNIQESQGHNDGDDVDSGADDSSDLTPAPTDSEMGSNNQVSSALTTRASTPQLQNLEYIDDPAGSERKILVRHSRIITLSLGRSAVSKRRAVNAVEDLSDLESDIESVNTTESVTKKKASSSRKKRKSAKGDDVSLSRSSLSSTANQGLVPLPTDEVEVDKILFVRNLNNVTHYAATTAEILDANPDLEFLIKFKNRSYLHCEWVKKDWIEGNDKRGKLRIRHFLEKTMHDLSYSLLSEEQPFNEAYTKIDRIIAKVENYKDPLNNEYHTWYLVKWQSRQYDECTWETEAVLVHECDDAEYHFDQYEHRNQLPHIRDPNYYKKCLPVGIRPPANLWTKLEESPKFKDENTLRPYQLEGLNWLMYCWYNRQSCIIADEMGLGKTVQSVAFLDQLYKVGIKGPFLIIAPLSTIPHWERTVINWTDLNCVVFHGSSAARATIQKYEFYYTDPQTGARVKSVVPETVKKSLGASANGFNSHKFDVVITTYEMAMSGATALKSVGEWRAVVVDEAHRLKNKTSKVGEVLKTFKMEHKLLLTGTPIQNSLEELWSILNFMDPTRFKDGTEKRFLEEHDLRSAADVERLQALLKPLMLRRLKEDVEKSIPVKEETIIEVELTNLQRAYYKAILEKNFQHLRKGGKRQNMPNLINAMMELRKCCIHPFLIQGAEEKILDDAGSKTNDEYYKTMIESSGKLVLLDKLLPKLKEGGHRVLIFSQMTRCLDLIGEYLRAKSYSYERIDGGIRGEARQLAIDRFSAPDSQIFCFLLCTRAGGVGINLTAADTCIIYDSDWNPQNDLQAQARCHRIGQKKNVKIYRLVTRNTYEKTMFDKAGLKLGLDKAVLSRLGDEESPVFGGSGGGNNLSSMSKEEIEELLKKGAYAALDNEDDENESKNFCNEDIDSILQRRTQVILHGDDGKDVKVNPAEGSLFSKATFAAAPGGPEGEQLEMNDPEFWEKWAKKANINPVEMLDPEEQARKQLYEETAGPRRRKVARYSLNAGDDDSVGGGDNDEFSIPDIVLPESLKKGYVRIPTPKEAGYVPWTMADRMRLERGLMLYGFGAWEKKKQMIKTRSIKDIKACELRLMKYCIDKLSPTTNKEDIKMFEDIYHICSLVRWEVPTDEDVENMMTHGCKASFVRQPYTVDFDEELGSFYPYPEATRKQLLEFRSFLDDAPKEYHDHLEKKPKNLLLRIQLVHIIREQMLGIDLHAVGEVPKDTEATSSKYDDLLKLRRSKIKLPSTYEPTFINNTDPNASSFLMISGWQHEEDKDLCVSVVKYGYQNYDLMKADPSFCFMRKKWKIANDVYIGNMPEGHVGVLFYNWPSGTDLGSRVRRIVTLYQRIMARNYSGVINNTKYINAILPQMIILPALPARAAAELPSSSIPVSGTPVPAPALASGPQFKWDKKDRSEFHKAVMALGIPELDLMTSSTQDAFENKLKIIEHISPDVVIALKRDWTEFKELSGLEDRTDYAMEQFLRSFVRRCEEIIKADDPNGLVGIGDLTVAARERKKRDRGDSGSANQNGFELDFPPPEVGLSDQNGNPLDPCEDMAVERAKRLLRRIALMRTLRREVLKDPYFELKIECAKKTTGLPDWWEPRKHDRAFLVGICKHGMTPLRQNLILFDEDLPFRQMVEEKLEAAGLKDRLQEIIKRNTTSKLELKRAENDLTVNDKTPMSSVVTASQASVQSNLDVNIEDLVGWPKDLIRTRRVEVLVEAVCNPSENLKQAISFMSSSSDSAGQNSYVGVENVPAMKFTDSVFKSSSDILSKIKSEHEANTESADSSDNDVLLACATKKLKKAIKLLKKYPRSQTLIQLVNDFVSGEDMQRYKMSMENINEVAESKMEIDVVPSAEGSYSEAIGNMNGHQENDTSDEDNAMQQEQIL